MLVKGYRQDGKGFSQPLMQLEKRSKALDTDRVISTQVCIEPVNCSSTVASSLIFVAG